MAQSNWVRVSRERPCPICGKADNCSISRDGGAVWCGRVSEGSIRQNDGGQFLHVLRDRDEWRDRLYQRPKSLPIVLPTEPRSKMDWGQFAQLQFEHSSAEAARQKLAEKLGVDAEALRRLGVGWIAVEKCWTFPERDATGKVIGISRRFANGCKRHAPGSESGLTFDPAGWMESAIEPSFVLLVEGASDTATLMSLGLSVVGRPSNTGGIELLAELLRDVPTDRVIVVVGEHDQKPHCSLSKTFRKWHKPECVGCSACWPGKFGAVTTATKLSERLGRPIAWAFPPENAKDARAWLNSQPKFETSDGT